MRQQQPITDTMTISDVKQRFNSLVNRVYRKETRIMVEKSGVPVAGIVSADDLRRLDRLDQERTERFKILDEFGDAFKDVPAEELEREVERAVTAVRSARRARQAEAVAATT